MKHIITLKNLMNLKVLSYGKITIQGLMVIQKKYKIGYQIRMHILRIEILKTLKIILLYLLKAYLTEKTNQTLLFQQLIILQ